MGPEGAHNLENAHNREIPYSRKYWQSLNLVVWPKTERKKYWQNLNLAVVPHSILHHRKHCMHVYRECCRPLVWGTWTKPWVHKKYNWQCASAALAICRARIEGHRVEPRALLHALRHYPLRAEIILADFNSAVSTLTTKLPNLIHHKFSSYTVCILCIVLYPKFVIKIS